MRETRIPRARNLFATRTMLGLYLLIAGIFIDNNDGIVAFIDRNYPGINGDNIKFWFSIVLYIAGAVRITAGRHRATDNVYTLWKIWGRSRSQAVANSRKN